MFANLIVKYNLYNSLYNRVYSSFIITSAISVFIGMLMTYKIEYYFLKFRDKHYPGRG
jgi:ABC-type transporter Mla maintaining outer membrane lipid asymmetry permease subunit MlaE